MSYNSNLPEDITLSRADIRENLRALKEDKIVDAATAVAADSAAKLTNARTINGVEFDGTKNITINVPTMPIGSIIMWAFSTLPGGDDEGKWLVCNGQSTNGYPELAAIAGATVPDYQGYFLRGLGGNSAELGAEQGDAIRNISGALTAYDGGALPTGVSSGAFKTLPGGGKVVVGAQDVRVYTTFDASRVVPTADENRPINKAVIYLIKAKQ